MCPRCRAIRPVDLAAACPGCGAAPAARRTALEPPPPRAEGWLFGPLFGGFLAALVLLGISHAAAFFVWAAASAATVAISVRHARQSGQPALPSATAALRRERRRALPPPT
jgi:hypothetical protein